MYLENNANFGQALDLAHYHVQMYLPINLQIGQVFY